MCRVGVYGHTDTVTGVSLIYRHHFTACVWFLFSHTSETVGHTAVQHCPRLLPGKSLAEVIRGVADPEIPGALHLSPGAIAVWFTRFGLAW